MICEVMRLRQQYLSMSCGKPHTCSWFRDKLGSKMIHTDSPLSRNCNIMYCDAVCAANQPRRSEWRKDLNEEGMYVHTYTLGREMKHSDQLAGCGVLERRY
jgi:hypothetical protein